MAQTSEAQGTQQGGPHPHKDALGRRLKRQVHISDGRQSSGEVQAGAPLELYPAEEDSVGSTVGQLEAIFLYSQASCSLSAASLLPELVLMTNTR